MTDTDYTGAIPVACPECGSQIMTPVKIVVIPDCTRRDKAPLTLATARYGPMRDHYKTANHG